MKDKALKIVFFIFIFFTFYMAITQSLSKGEKMFTYIPEKTNITSIKYTPDAIFIHDEQKRSFPELGGSRGYYENGDPIEISE